MDILALLIEPNPLHARLFADVVRLMGIDCMVATTGDDGMLTACLARPDLIITELVLPDCDGRDLILKMRDQVETAMIPIIVLTASDGVVNQNECLAFGANVFAGKPIRLAALRKIVADALCQKATGSDPVENILLA